MAPLNPGWKHSVAPRATSTAAARRLPQQVSILMERAHTKSIDIDEAMTFLRGILDVARVDRARARARR